MNRHRQTLPSSWVQRFGKLASTGDTALDLACGNGRNGRWLRDRGLIVTFLDRDVSALADLSDTEIIKTNLESGGPFPLGDRTFDCVVVTNYLWRDILVDIGAAVIPGGLLIYETFGLGNEMFGRPRNPNFLLKPGELATAVKPAFHIIGYEHGLRTEPSDAVVQRLAAIKL